MKTPRIFFAILAALTLVSCDRSNGDKDLVFRTDDIVVLLGEQTELDHLTSWFTSHRHTKAVIPQSV